MKQGTVRAEDTVARLGGDEYVVLVHDLDPKGVPAIANKLLAALDKPFHWQGYFMGRPMPVEKLGAWLRESTWSNVPTVALSAP